MDVDVDVGQRPQLVVAVVVVVSDANSISIGSLRCCHSIAIPN